MEKILVIQTAFIGDSILTLPMLKKIKERNSGCLVDVLCTPVSKEIFESSPYVNRAISVDKRGRQKSLWALYKFCKENLASQNYTHIYSVHRSMRTSLIVLFSNVRETYGFSNSSLKAVYKHIVKYDSSQHEVKRNLALAGFSFEDDGWKILPEAEASEHTREKVKLFIEENKLDKFIVLAPASVWATKAYPKEYFIEIARYFSQKDYNVVLMGGEKDRIILKEFLDLSDKIISAAGSFSLVESVELLRHATILVANDSAPAHLALCANVPVLMLYCSTIPEFGFYPYSRKSGYLNIEGLSCKPCGIHGKKKCPVGTFDCGKKLTPGLVIKKTEEMINEYI